MKKNIQSYLKKKKRRRNGYDRRNRNRILPDGDNGGELDNNRQLRKTSGDTMENELDRREESGTVISPERNLEEEKK